MDDEKMKTLNSDNSLSILIEKKVKVKRQWLKGNMESKDEFVCFLGGRYRNMHESNWKGPFEWEMMKIQEEE